MSTAAAAAQLKWKSILKSERGSSLAACESTQAHLELWAVAQGNPNPTCNSLYPSPALCTIHILIFLHFIWNKFHEKEQRIQGVSVLGSATDTAAYTDFLSPPIS